MHTPEMTKAPGPTGAFEDPKHQYINGGSVAPAEKTGNPPAELAKLPGWLIWSYQSEAPGKKPRKVPRYANGTSWGKHSGAEDAARDLSRLVTFEVAKAAASRLGAAGVGFAPRPEFGIVALDFDNCVVSGSVLPEVERLITGTYAELSPSGRGVRAFMRGDLGNHKDHAGPFGFETFSSKGFVTFTGNPLDITELLGAGETIAPVTEAVRAFSVARFGAQRVTSAPATDDPLMAFEPPVGIELSEARKLLVHVDNEDYDTWLKVGMSLHHEFSGSGEALALWDTWSSSAASYASADDLAHRWESFGRDGEVVTARSLIKMSREGQRRRGYSSKEDKTDTGNANLLVRLTNGDLRRVPDRGVWLWWDGDGWFVDTHGVKAQAATALVAKYYQDEAEGIAKMAAEPARDSVERKRLEKVSDAVAKWEKQCRNRRGIDNMLAVAAKDPQLHLDASELDRDPWLLGVANGVVDLRTGRLRPAARDEYVTKRATVAFNPTARAPRWERFVDEVTGVAGDTAGEFQSRPELAAYLQRALGYSLSGSVAEQKMFICIGAGSNGKNVMLDMFQHVTGEYCQTIPPALLMTTKHDDAEKPSPTAALLAGARMAICSESNDGHRLDGALVKRQTGGGQLTARRMRENTFKFEITHKLWLMTNHRPALNQLDDAMRGRLHLIPFDRRWNRPGHPERDPRLPDGDRDLMGKLKEEAEGVLAWLVRGVVAYLAEGLVPPGEVTRMTRDYFNDQDAFGAWLETCERCEPQAGELASDLFERFLSYCNSEGLADPHPSTQRAFSSELQRRGVEKRRDNQGARYGLRETSG